MRRGTHWRRVSELVRARQPLCCDPFGEHTVFPEPAAQVHHVVPFEARPDLAYDFRNLASVCTRCHSRVERMHQAGTPTAHLFIGKTADAAP